MWCIVCGGFAGGSKWHGAVVRVLVECKNLELISPLSNSTKIQVELHPTSSLPPRGRTCATNKLHAGLSLRPASAPPAAPSSPALPALPADIAAERARIHARRSVASTDKDKDFYTTKLTRHQPRLLILVRNSGMHAFLTAVRSAPAMRLHPWIRTAKSPERPTCCLSPHHNHIHFPAQAAPLPEYTFGVLIAWCRSSRLPESSSGTHRGLVHPHHSRTASSACGRCQPLCRRATAAPPQPRRRSRA